jgi:hypothetical protein
MNSYYFDPKDNIFKINPVKRNSSLNYFGGNFFFYEKEKIRNTIITGEFDFSDTDGAIYFDNYYDLYNYNNYQNEILIGCKLTIYGKSCLLSEYLEKLKLIDYNKYLYIKNISDKYNYNGFTPYNKLNYWNYEGPIVTYYVNTEEDRQFIIDSYNK